MFCSLVVLCSRSVLSNSLAEALSKLELSMPGDPIGYMGLFSISYIWSYLYLETYRLPIGSPGIDHCINCLELLEGRSYIVTMVLMMMNAQILE